MKQSAQVFVAMFAVLAMTAILAPHVGGQDQEPFDLETKAHELADEILQEIHDMPDYGAFDVIHVYLSGTPEGATVTVVGSVSRVRLRTHISSMLDDMHHVIAYNNNLVDMSGGPAQARVRIDLYNAIYDTYLPDYSAFLPGERAVGGTQSHTGHHPIHILVDDEMNVILTGYVFSAKDKSTATMACERTPQTSTCTNDLTIVPKPEGW